MVSTRAMKYRFAQGEKVLCYEPDPTKAKVLYDSKVLQVIIKKDNRGRKTVEYLIHFQGWNSSWDRFVGEDYVLKDTDENRRLQKELAHKAQLQQGAYLYRRERKRHYRRFTDRTNDSLDRKRSGRKRNLELDRPSEDDEDEQEEEEEQGETINDDDLEEAVSSVPSHHSEEDNISSPDELSEEDDNDDDEDEQMSFELGSTLLNFLDQDFCFINEKNKLVKLPAEPNVVAILEGYMKHCSVVQLCGISEKPDRRSRQTWPSCETNDIVSTCRSLNLAKEVVDSIRITFDFILGTNLLYAAEKNQYASFLNPSPVKKEPGIDGDEYESTCLSYECSTSADLLNGSDEVNIENKRHLRSCRSPTDTGSTRTVDSGPSCSRNVHSPDPFIPLSLIKEENDSDAFRATTGTPDTRNNALLSKILSWHMIPEKLYHKKPPLPCIIYGAVHLTRLMYKLPVLLNNSDITNRNLKVVLKNFDSFCRYLEQHTEWFSDAYIDKAAG